MKRIASGPGLRVIGGKWYGHCGVCGTRDIVPCAVRWWDPDDGWRLGVLCGACIEHVRDRGPRVDDYAVATRDVPEQAARIDLNAALGDLDGTWSEVTP